MTHTCMHTNAGTHCVNHKISIQNTNDPHAHTAHTNNPVCPHSGDGIFPPANHQSIKSTHSLPALMEMKQQMAEKISSLNTSSST